MDGDPSNVTVLQVLPSLVTGGVERGTVEITQAIVGAGWTGLVASAGGRLVPAVRARRRPPHRAAADQPGPSDDLAQRGAARGGDPGRAGGDRACTLARAGVVGVARLPAHRRALRHHLPRDLRRGPAVQAPLQLGDGEGRAGDRGKPLHRRADRGAPRDRSDPRAGHPSRRRSGAVRSGSGLRRSDGAPGAGVAGAGWRTGRCCCPAG